MDRSLIIDLSNSSDEDLLVAENGLEPEFQFYSQLAEDHLDSLDGHSLAYDEISRREAERYPSENSYEFCLKEITEVFPNICHDHVKTLFDRHCLNIQNGEEAVHLLVEQIISSGEYPKERDRQRKLKELKRKRADQPSDDEEAARWKYDGLKHSPLEYAKVS